MQTAQCDATLQDTGDNCFAAFMGLHLTSGSSAYLEVGRESCIIVQLTQFCEGHMGLVG